MNFETVIGLEVHCELKTKSKMFSGAPVTFGQAPNTNVNIVDLGMTGAMPVLNKAGVEYAIRVCSALNMEIDELVCFDRKNYYYSDLPKGFQITQDRHPIGRNGTMNIEVNGQKQVIEIERLHMEEDTAKQLHFDDYSLIDYNRAGIPLIEIVTRPTIRSGAAAAAYLEKLRQILLFTDVSDAKMEEGSMRCDVNVSIRPFGSDKFGTRTEIKNLNSISNVQKAIEYEVARQEKVLISGGEVLQETRRYDEDKKETVVMRAKGDAVDYKYYPEPNILPIRLDHQWVEDIIARIPEMPESRVERYINEYKIPKTDALILVQTKEISDFFEAVVNHTKYYKIACNWMLGEVQAYLNKNNLIITDTKMAPEYLAKMINYIQDGTISSKQGKKVFEILIKEGKDPEIIIEENNMKQISSPEELTVIINEVLDANSQSIEDYRNGKDRAVGFLIGQIMKKTGGQANPAVSNKLLVELLKQRIS
ncbi:MAG TPA: Asp-tRNA(Asn)/Glu-tRNA(Gln) amidotransferase subunit GatB [Candidatus Erysipelatoclostridium merdavium]|uniref:Aspartyl/glutamyl-tRNA(Asn/Gln) amidotransferase subunit B n=1 Tax=Candidatus Erysipelatoclostridium merdavium TaxID=2838566 RepID=A0A9D2BMI5_9FIRM|nr:Asp-tRNA(Asn)/Glu-tRNA(Gln) amidotransferase subunit GatB [Candidatus Erysipelatoclostridium merdavium]